MGKTPRPTLRQPRTLKTQSRSRRQIHKLKICHPILLLHPTLRNLDRHPFRLTALLCDALRVQESIVDRRNVRPMVLKGFTADVLDSLNLPKKVVPTRKTDILGYLILSDLGPTRLDQKKELERVA